MAGERKLQILQALAEMLQTPTAEKVTTAALAAHLNLSEAALYRHFASKAQMYEGLIGFIEQSIFGLINRITTTQDSGSAQLEAMIKMLLGFAEKNPGMARVLIGEALVNENERLQARINQLLDRIEASLRQSLRIAAAQLETRADATLAANLLLCVVIGRWQLFAKSGFKRMPTADFTGQWEMLRLVFAV
uniref:Putative Bacterial regulatory protein, TetR n=1 Tax=mine drainage metagenome TaxID=410659 RepID=E6QQX5_9ZZZZ